MATDAIELGQRVIALLETGRRTATYKLALLLALGDHCVEHYADEQQALDVPLEALARRVVAIYWRQVRPMPVVGALRQTTQPRALIIDAVDDLRRQADVLGVTSVDVMEGREPAAYAAALGAVVMGLVRQPLPRLQRLPGAERSEAFLYDDSWMGDKVSRRAIDVHQGLITLHPGVAHGLARIAGLLRPVIELLWVEDVVRLNASLREGHDDVAGHLFGRERVGLGRVREALHGTFGARCFYCEAALTSVSPIDHVLPWSRVGIDGLANLVPACAACNASKTNALPVPRHVYAALRRDRQVLDAIGRDIAWPVEWARTRDTARGLYLASSPGSPLWDGPKRFIRVDLTWGPALEYGLWDSPATHLDTR